MRNNAKITKSTEGIGNYLHYLNEKKYWCRKQYSIQDAEEDWYEAYTDKVLTDDILDYYYDDPDRDYYTPYQGWWEDWKAEYDCQDQQVIG